MNATVRVHGLKELQRELRKIDGKVGKEFGDGLKKAAEPVVSSARSKVGRYRGSSPGTIRAKRSGAARVFVEQSKRKVTGRRGDFGALQMRNVLMPALDENQGEVFDKVDNLLRTWTAGF